MPMPSNSTLVIEMWSSESETALRKIEIKKPRLDINDDPTHAKGATAKAKAQAVAESGVFMDSKGNVFDMLANFYYKTVTKTPIVSQVQAREHKAKRASQGKE